MVPEGKVISLPFTNDVETCAMDITKSTNPVDISFVNVRFHWADKADAGPLDTTFDKVNVCISEATVISFAPLIKEIPRPGVRPFIDKAGPVPFTTKLCDPQAEVRVTEG